MPSRRPLPEFDFQIPRRPPELIGHYAGLAIFNEGAGFVLPRVRQLLQRDATRFADVCGTDVHLVLNLLDWRATSAPECVTAADGDIVVAAAWAGGVITREGSRTGANLSFAVAPQYEGRGLATVLTALAYAKCLSIYPTLSFANIQTEASNAGAHSLAGRLDMDRAPEYDRIVPPPKTKVYFTFRAPASQVAARCHQIISAAFAETDSNDADDVHHAAPAIGDNG